MPSAQIEPGIAGAGVEDLLISNLIINQKKTLQLLSKLKKLKKFYRIFSGDMVVARVLVEINAFDRLSKNSTKQNATTVLR